MKSKRFFLTTFVILSLALGSLVAFAQAPEPPWPRELPERPEIPPERFPNPRLDGQPGEQPYLSPSKGVSSPLNPAVTLGQPGLSFRYVQTFGVTEVGYLTDGYHLNAPSGLFIDGSNNLYVVEDHGYRLLRYDSSGTNTLAIGVAGLCVDGNNPTRFCTPQDVALDSGGNIWVATGNRVVKFNSSGVYQTQLPIPSSSGSWSSGNDNTHFRMASGIAFDNTNGRMFVADRNNHRVQVYTFSGSNPVYSATIGVTGISGNDNTHFNSPRRLAVDSNGRLYVVDYNNRRIQRCTLSGTWSCATFGSEIGSMRPRGISIDTADKVYIIDTENGRVIKCGSGGSCSDLISGILNSHDVAVDTNGRIYAGAYGHSVIRKYNSSGGLVGDFVGTWHESYFPGGNYVFTPWGIAVAADGSLYVTESYGYRLLKFNAAGVRQWAIGDPGGWGEENDRFNTLEGKPAIANNGNIYVPDSGNARIQVFDSNGGYISTFGSYGTGNDQFAWPMGIAISPVNGDIYVADNENHRVQVYNSSFGYLTTLGVTGSSGSDSSHFNYPYDVALDASGNIFVADYENYRVQKCTLSGINYSCTTFAGETGVMNDDFDHLTPIGIALDKTGRVYVADDWNNRIQVFDATGAYLTTLGASWGSLTGQFRAAVGIAIDNDGNVYISDMRNNRVQKFSPSVPGWAQVNINGFGDIANSNIHTLASFGGNLYAGTWNGSGNGAQIWKLGIDHNWTQAITPGFGNGQNQGMNHLLSFNNQLYAGVRNDIAGASIYRSSDGSIWNPVVTSGFNDPNNAAVYRFAVFNGQIYAGTGIFTTTHGAEIWRSPNGDAGTWTQVVSNGFDNQDNYIMRTSEIHNGYLYFGTQNIDTSTYMTTTGGIVIRSNTGDSGNWAKVTLDGFGDINNFTVSGLASFGGYLYASTGRWDWSGIQVWRCQICDNPSSWEKVVDNGFGNPNNWGLSTLQVFDGKLYLVIGNGMTGMEIWCTTSGNSGEWTQISNSGFGDSNNDSPYFNNVTTFNNNLYIGTSNGANGGEVWLYLNKRIYLPLARR